MPTCDADGFDRFWLARGDVHDLVKLHVLMCWPLVDMGSSNPDNDPQALEEGKKGGLPIIK